MMSKEKMVFQLLGETTASIYPLARDVMRPLFEEHFSEQHLYGPTFLAFQLQPQAISKELLLRRNPYNNPADRKEILAEAAKVGYLVQEGENYLISEKGKATITDVHQSFYAHVNQIDHFPAEKMKALADLLEVLVKSVAKTKLSDGLFCFDCSHNGHPPVDPGTLAHVDQLLDDLNAFRDDAHIAAWKSTGLDGHTLEVLTLVWNEQASTADQLVELLPYRSFLLNDYQSTLEKLEKKGWIVKGTEGFIASDEGKKIRDQIEDATDTNYFTPWNALTENDLAALENYLTELIEANQALIEDAE
jgi:DNA-binding PadR family transcriptional regulator